MYNFTLIYLYINTSGHFFFHLHTFIKLGNFSDMRQIHTLSPKCKPREPVEAPSVTEWKRYLSKLRKLHIHLGKDGWLEKVTLVPTSDVMRNHDSSLCEWAVEDSVRK